MRILVHHDGRQLGPFTVDEARAALNQGSIRLDDLAWHEGLAEWVSLGSLLGAAVPVPQPPAAQATVSGLAVTSLVLGIATFFFCVFTGLPAIVFGHVARGEIRRSGGTIGGDGLAI